MGIALPVEARLEIYDRHVAGEPLHAVAEDLGIHYETARKWWRVGRDRGREALVARPRKPIGKLRAVPSKVIKLLHNLRKQHPQWGVPYLRQQLLIHPQLSKQQRAQVPSQATLYRYLHAVEEEPFKHKPKHHVPTTRLIHQTTHSHHLWQVDLKEKCKVKGLDNRFTVINMRDVYSSVTTGAVIYELTRTSSGVNMADVQHACRSAFAQWGLPDRLRTDNGGCFVGTMPQTGFPSYFTLWLIGLDVKHETIDKGQVTQNGCVERFNRTYNNLVLKDGPFKSAEQLHALSQATVDFLNTQYPSHAGSCQGRPPLEAHPSAAKPRRRYSSGQEKNLFSLQRVDAYLTQFRWQRRTDGVGKVSMGRIHYYLGRANRRLVFDVTFDPKHRAFVFTTPDHQTTITKPALGLDQHDILDIRTSQPKRLRKSEKR
jgi:transposase InsO family protein